jgi:hypothetical protein
MRERISKELKTFVLSMVDDKNSEAFVVTRFSKILLQVEFACVFIEKSLYAL